MKPVASTLTEIDNLPGEEVKFSISDANSAWVMRSMADLYSNRELAVVREYSTNAYDSNLEKAMRDGTEVAPIHVTLPSALNPYFEVRDYGVGMSETELKEIYTQFGESTKRISDDFNGMLGFGCKSGIAYTNTFTVTAVKNRRKCVAVITRREDSMGGYLVTLKIILAVETNDPDGVAIQIPVHNWQEFERKAKDYYRFWLPGTVLVNGKEPEWAVGEKIDDNLYYFQKTGYATESYVVMGNVPYRIANPDALFPRGMNKISFVAYVPIGAVEFTPSREDLKYSEHTKKNLHKIIEDFVTKSVQKAKDEIAAATTHFEAYTAWSKWRKMLGAAQVADLTFKGTPLVDTFPLHGLRYQYTGSRYSRGGTYLIREWFVEQMHDTLIVTDFSINLSSSHKKKVREWMNLKGISAHFIIFTEATSVTSPWVDPSRVVQWKTVKAEAPKPPRKPRQANVAWGRKAGSFDLITRSGRKAEQDVPSTKELFYITVQQFKTHRNLPYILDDFGMDHEVVLVPANRMAKFLRFYPKAKPILPYLKSKVELDGMSLLSENAKLILKTNPEDYRTMQRMDETMVKDPEIKKMIALFKEGEEKYLGAYRKHHGLANMLGMSTSFKPHPWRSTWDKKHRPLIEKYPLASYFSSLGNNKNDTHVYLYMNAVYKARKEGKNV